MRKLWIPAILVVVVAASVSAQAILEYGAAAAGGSAAGVAGKKVSDSLDKVMNKVVDMTKNSATTDNRPRKMAPAVPPVPEVRLRDLNPPQEAAKSRNTTAPGRRQANLRPAGSPAETVSAPPANDPVGDPVSPAPEAPAPPPAPVATIEDLKSLDGASREAVLTKMGKPASRITMSDDRGLVETYSFRNSNGNLGSVQIINGTVATVRPAQ
jgi:hypothetical protein